MGGNEKFKEQEKIVAPEQEKFITVDFDGLESFLDTHRSKTLVVNFWATWCAPCIKELPAFEELGERYRDKEVLVILVSLDFPNQLERLAAFIEKHNLQSQIVFLNDPNENTWISKVDPKWSGAIPATLMINKGERKFYERPFNYTELESVLRANMN